MPQIFVGYSLASLWKVTAAIMEKPIWFFQ